MKAVLTNTINRKLAKGVRICTQQCSRLNIKDNNVAREV